MQNPSLSLPPPPSPPLPLMTGPTGVGLNITPRPWEFGAVFNDDVLARLTVQNNDRVPTSTSIQ